MPSRSIHPPFGALYASGQFVVIHTRTGGTRHLRLPEKAAEVRDVFSDQVVARSAREFAVDLPAKTMVVYDLVGA
jgi:hypothetical protein